MEEFSTIRRIGDVMASLSPRRAAARDHRPASVGVFIQWGIGDAVLTTPLLAGLRAAWPEARIDAIGKPWLSDLFAGERFVDRCVTLAPPWTATRGKYRVWDREWRVFARDIAAARRTRYDLLIGIRWDTRELLLSRALSAAGMAGFAGAGGRKWVTIDLGLDAAGHRARHRSEVAAHAALMLTGRAVSPVPSLSVPERERRDMLERIRSAGRAGGPVVAVHTGAGSPIRRWPIERFNAVLRSTEKRIGCLVLIDDGSAAGFAPPPGIPFLAWRGTLSGLKALLSACDILLCNDAGPMHVAAAVGCRVVAVFGPGMDKWFHPTGSGHRMVIEEPMPCRPCLDRCIYAEPVCMDRIGVEVVSASLSDALVASPYRVEDG